ncbi:MAG: hypothetical protein JKY88_06700 [Pseudomonadales bacterium]|nr:hypothetical protein [Pseudomonadales bacterium]
MKASTTLIPSIGDNFHISSSATWNSLLDDHDVLLDTAIGMIDGMAGDFVQTRIDLDTDRKLEGKRLYGILYLLEMAQATASEAQSRMFDTANRNKQICIDDVAEVLSCALSMMANEDYKKATETLTELFDTVHINTLHKTGL